MDGFSISQKNRDILNGFLETFAQSLDLKNCLLLQGSELNLFDETDLKALEIQRYSVGDDIKKGKWDLIIGDIALGVRDNRVNDKGTLGWAGNTLIKSLEHLKPNGFAIFLLEPSHLENGSKSIRIKLQEADAQLSCILNTPESLLKPYTALRPILVIVKKGKVEKEFVAELESLLQAEALALNVVSAISTESLEGGIFLERGEFQGFYRWKIKHQIDQLQSEYKSFTRKLVRDVVVEIRTCRLNEKFQDLSGCIYFPKLGTNPVTSCLSSITAKHHNVYQIVCRSEVVIPAYLALFFESPLGRLIRGSITTHGFVHSISKTELMNAEIALPEPELQKDIIESIKKLEFIKSKVSKFEENLALNPIGSQAELQQIDSILGAVGELADTDRIKSLIRLGESKSIEFKQTFCLDVVNGIKESRIEDSAIKTVAAFLNSDGGTLLVGVHDNGQITGNEEEIEKFFKSRDKFLLHVKNRIKTRIGEQFYPFINHRLVDIDQKSVLIIECEPSSEEVFVDEKDFYVRTNPATDRLEGRKLTDYIKHRFRH
jgi:hypothetical protein